MATTGSSGGGGSTENGLQHQHQRQVVHVRENSDSAMEDLFSVIKNPQKLTANSFRHKNLPKSFFSPPDPNRNSRENLLMQQQQAEIPFGAHPGLVAQHSRSRSSPAQLPNSLSLQQQQQQQQVSHRAQHSVDFTEEMQMPQQWADRNNHRYMLNSPGAPQQQGSATASPANSQWSVNAKSLSSGNLVEANNNTPLNHLPTASSASALSPASSSHGPSPATSLQNLSLSTPPTPRCALLSLPPGWDISLTPDNEIYYINHLNKTTDWYHPTLPRTHQGAGPMKLSQLPPSQQQQILQHQQHTQQQQQLQQQQQQQQQQLSPQQQQQLAAAARQQQLTTSPNSSSNGNNGNASEEQIFNELKRLQKEKERLQREQEDISKRVGCTYSADFQEHLLKTNFGPPGHPQSTTTPTTSPSSAPPSSSSSSHPPPHLSIIGEEPAAFGAGGGGIVSQAGGLNGHANARAAALQEMMLKKDLMLSPGEVLHQPPASVGLDPFLGHSPAPPHSSTATLESHARQNSADSGLGGMGTNYSLPRTPEDFLSNVEEMDSSNDGVMGVQKLLKAGLAGGLNNGLSGGGGGGGNGGLAGGDFSMDTGCGIGGGHTSMDIGALGDIGDPSSSIGDDLMSTLQDDMMTTDLLNDADLQKDLLNQTWL